MESAPSVKPYVVIVGAGFGGLEAAKKLQDWIASKEANELYAGWWQVVAMPGIAKPQPNIPENYEQLTGQVRSLGRLEYQTRAASSL